MDINENISEELRGMIWVEMIRVVSLHLAQKCSLNLMLVGVLCVDSFKVGLQAKERYI